MKISAVRDLLERQGTLDARRLLSFATLSGNVSGADFQNIVAVCFQETQLEIYRANLDNTIGDRLTVCPYDAVTDFQKSQRIVYNYVSFSCGKDRFKFYSFDKKVFDRGFQDAGILKS